MSLVFTKSEKENEMKETLDNLRFLLKNSGQEDIIKKPTTPAEIYEREKKYNSPIPVLKCQ